MRKRIKRKLKMRMWFKIFLTYFILFVGVQIYYNLSLLGSNNNNLFDEIMLVLGWLWIVFGQISVLYFIWE